MPMSMQSADFRDGERLTATHEYNDFGGSGDNRSPQLQWSDAPQGTKSYAVTVYDPDAPTGSGFWHWVAFDIPVDVFSLPQNAGASYSGAQQQPFIQSINDYGRPGFGGACPPEGADAHRYIFTVHALSVDKLGLDASATNAVARFMINAHAIEHASITAFYQR